MVLTVSWMVVMVIGGTWWVRRDVAAYAHFKTLIQSADRRLFYRRWLIESFAILVTASLVSLWFAGGLSPFRGFPDAFAPANQLLQTGDSDGDHWLPVALGLSAGIVTSVAIQWRRLKKVLERGPDAALIPRNRTEGILALLLSLNAGFCEELFFRLALPLLLLQVTHSLAVSLVGATICFGLAHAHYGLKGMLATMAAGALLAFYYLHHGSLLRVMIAHAVIDVLAFFVRPAVADWLMLRKFPDWAASSG